MSYRTLFFYLTCACYFFIFAENLGAQSIRLTINEFMASNTKMIADEHGEYDDWIELFNDDENSVNLAGLYLSDDFSDPTRWRCPAVTIPAKGFLIIWADDDTSQGKFHANFKLSADGEQLALFDGIEFSDSLTYRGQRADISYGRYPDGKSDWYFYTSPTPCTANTSPNNQFAENPVFSPSGGFFPGPVAVELQVTAPQAQIYYTLDCSDPTENSNAYSSSIQIDKTTVIRARTYQPGFNASDIQTLTFIIGQNFDLATLSLVTDPPNLWDESYGIYVNPNERGDNWERPAAVEFYEPNDNLGFAVNIGVRIHGKTAQNYEKKPFRLYFRSEYGTSWLDYPVFVAKSEVTEFKRFVVHSGGTDMPDNPFGYGWTLLRDPFMYELGRQARCIYPGLRPVALFLNGAPWGIYNFEERIDNNFTESNFGESDVDIIENDRIAKEGDLDEWERMRAFFNDHDLSITENYEIAKTLVDIENVTNYNIVEIFGGNGDWPGNNQLAYRPRKPGAKWRWILWDMDGCLGPYGVYANTLELATDPDHPSALVLRSLLQNESYKIQFINRFADLLNTLFTTSNVKYLIDSLATVIRNDISFETDRWDSSPNSWEEDGIYGELYPYAERRPGVVRRHILSHFDLDGELTFTIDLPLAGQGSIRVNSILIDSLPWHGTYYKKIPIELEAIPDRYYEFDKWSDSTLAQNSKISLFLENDFTISAAFKLDPVETYLVINEINYNSAPQFDPRDWIELFNPSTDSVDVSRWHFKDEDDSHDFTFPDHTIIAPDGFLVLCQDQSAFHDFFPDITNYIGNFDFGLDGNGDAVRIYNANWMFVDSVKFDDSPPWKTEPDGKGPTLELIDPGLDNSVPENWQASMGHGTPGMINSDHGSSVNLDDKYDDIPVNYVLYQNYPNPFNGATKIHFEISRAGLVQITIYNMLGEKIKTMIDHSLPAGEHRLDWKGRDEYGQPVPSGIYLYRFQVNQFSQTKKMIITR